MNRYDISIATNAAFIPGAFMALASLARNAKPESQLVFHVFTEQVNPRTMDELRRVLKRIHPESVVKQYECDDKLLDGLPYWAGSRMASVRVYFPQIMKEVDRCLYLDCDIVYLASVEEHFSFFDESKYAVVVKDEGDHFCWNEVDRIEKYVGMKIERGEYFNSGVILFNFKKMREDNMSQKLADFMVDHPDSALPDQTALNCLFNHKTVMAPAKFNRLIPQLTPEKLYERPVLHFISGKPWTQKFGEVANARFRFWHKYADKVIWNNEGESTKRLFSQKMMLIKYLLYWGLRFPVIGHFLSWAMNVVGKTAGSAQSWRQNQIIKLHEGTKMLKAFSKVLECADASVV